MVHERKRASHALADRLIIGAGQKRIQPEDLACLVSDKLHRTFQLTLIASIPPVADDNNHCPGVHFLTQVPQVQLGQRSPDICTPDQLTDKD